MSRRHHDDAKSPRLDRTKCRQKHTYREREKLFVPIVMATRQLQYMFAVLRGAEWCEFRLNSTFLWGAMSVGGNYWNETTGTIIMQR